MQPTGVSAFARATLQSDLDQRCERDAQLEQLPKEAGAPGLGPLAAEKAQQRDRTHSPQWRMANAQRTFPIVTQAPEALQGLQQRGGFVAYFLTMHFHAQTDQRLAQFATGVALMGFGFAHGISRSRSLASSSRVAWNGEDSSKMAAFKRSPQNTAARK